MKSLIAVALLSVLCAGCSGTGSSRTSVLASEQGFRWEQGEVAFCGVTRIPIPEDNLVLYTYIGAMGKHSMLAVNTKTGAMCATGNLHVEDFKKLLDDGAIGIR